jgi:DMSO/TMAO reductase YedYZ molybdopterin-dependent catalytic subunit
MPIVSRGFRRRQPDPGPGVTLPPGQHLVDGFPVLSAGPTPHVPLEAWDLTVEGAVGAPQRWTWEEYLALPGESVSVDIHCVTSWSKLGTRWEGVSVDTLLGDAEPAGGFLLAVCDGDYTTNLPLEDVTGGKAWVVHGYDGRPLEPEHGGPARLLVPHLYFWKSAKWVRRLVVLEREQLGFWEELGYHRRGDPWREQRYRDDF